tara:strand:+ start:30 stop:593 length:564 start_codon:yes stop_codon:yes gene_type:complete
MATTINGTTGVSLIQDGVIALADLSATGTPSASTFLRGDNAWAAPAGGGMTLLATLTTTSGTSHTTGTISLTDNKFLYIVARGVSHSAGSGENLQWTPNGGTAVYMTGDSVVAGSTLSSINVLDLATGMIQCFAKVDLSLTTANPAAWSQTSVASNNGLTVSTTSIVFDFSSGATFDAGSIKIYGLK